METVFGSYTYSYIHANVKKEAQQHYRYWPLYSKRIASKTTRKCIQCIHGIATISLLATGNYEENESVRVTRKLTVLYVISGLGVQISRY